MCGSIQDMVGAGIWASWIIFMLLILIKCYICRPDWLPKAFIVTVFGVAVGSAFLFHFNGPYILKYLK